MDLNADPGEMLEEMAPIHSPHFFEIVHANSMLSSPDASVPSPMPHHMLDGLRSHASPSEYEPIAPFLEIGPPRRRPPSPLEVEAGTHGSRPQQQQPGGGRGSPSNAALMGSVTPPPVDQLALRAAGGIDLARAPLTSPEAATPELSTPPAAQPAASHRSSRGTQWEVHGLGAHAEAEAELSKDLRCEDGDGFGPLEVRHGACDASLVHVPRVRAQHTWRAWLARYECQRVLCALRV